MRIGKVTESILKRSVFRKITYRSGDLLDGPSVGKDAGKIRIAQKGQLAVTANPVMGPADLLGRRAFFRAANDLACSGVKPSGMLLTLLMPPDSGESEIRQIMGQMGELAAQYHVDLLGGHTEVCAGVTMPVATVTGFGYCESGSQKGQTGLKTGMDIVMTKWAGESGAARLAKDRREELRTRFSEDFIERAQRAAESVSCLPAAAVAWEAGAAILHNVSESGVFRALWELGSAGSAGLEVDLKSIPVRQETIEICEFFDVNPYMAASEGVLLAGTDGGAQLVKAFEDNGIPAAVIGFVREDNDRVVVNGDERRFLTPVGD